MKRSETHLPSTAKKTVPFDPSILNEEEKERYQTLKAWCADRATKKNIPPYVIAQNAQLAAIAKLNPSTKEELYTLKGFAETKVNRYGDEIIAVLNSI